MKDFEEMAQLRQKTKAEVLRVVAENFEKSVKNNDSEMVLAFAESLKAVFNS